ncbi:hypothetical protein pipiens_017438, partial [Culex pipiens pipiens]
MMRLKAGIKVSAILEQGDEAESPDRQGSGMSQEEKVGPLEE